MDALTRAYYGAPDLVNEADYGGEAEGGKRGDTDYRSRKERADRSSGAAPCRVRFFHTLLGGRIALRMKKSTASRSCLRFERSPATETREIEK